MTAIPAAHAEPIPLPCPRCGYDLRGSQSSVCPECGEAFDADALATTAAIPWQSRREIGRARAFRRTVWLALRHPARLARQASRPVDYPDARRFQLVCVTLAWLALAPLEAWWLWPRLRAVANINNYLSGNPRFPRPDVPSAALDLVADGTFVFAAVAGLFAFLLTASGAASYFFDARGRAGVLRDRNVAFSYYAAAPLALVPVFAVLASGAWFVAWTFENAYGLSNPSRDMALYLIMIILAAAALLVGAVIVVGLVLLPIVFLARGLHASLGRLGLCLVLLVPVAWPVLLLVFAVGLPALVFYVQLVWSAFT